jgi:putative lipoic acid-binding regulatory protein
MGTYDPAGQDTEEASTGNILHAMLHFPTTYTFYVVLRRSSDDDDNNNNDPAQDVLDVVREGAGLSDDDVSLEAEVTPRGTKFVKVSVTVTVESGGMIADIYDRLQAMPHSLMQF